MKKPLEIFVVRRWFSDEESIGELHLDKHYLTGKRFCYTLEDQVRPAGEKVMHETAIPYGTYPVELTFSPKYNKIMPLIENVPGFTGIRIHPGNDDDDTSGCLLVGFGKTEHTITQSKLAFDALYQVLEQATQEGRPITITFLHA